MSERAPSRTVAGATFEAYGGFGCAIVVRRAVANEVSANARLGSLSLLATHVLASEHVPVQRGRADSANTGFGV